MLISVAISCSDDSDNDNVDEGTEESVDGNLPDITGFPIVDTNQSTYYDNSTSMSTPSVGDDFYGQDATYQGNQPSYTDNGDGTVTDNVTGLMWQNTLDHNQDGTIDYDDKLTYDEILALEEGNYTYAGYSDWRVPSIKEQYSLMAFSGRDISGYEGTSTDGLTPFINTDYFDYAYGDTNAGERLIDVQCASTNVSVGSAIEMVFGVNFADGRIKGYGTTMMGQDKVFNYLLVRGNTTYGVNDFTDNGDGTISDEATGLMWMQDDNGEGVNWKEALSHAESMEFAGYTDWRLPNAKELQSIVDYTRSPQTTSSAAIDPLFNSTQITNEAGEADYPFYWSGTTHANWTSGNDGAWGAYVAFGRAMGNESMPTGPMGDTSTTTTDSSAVDWTDVHGAGAQRSDPKDGDPDDYPTGNGPQGDAVRVFNYVRLVRNIN
ncbi:DUF1566 domain-containing protein [Maribacter sp. ANRC-HE7]|uniref:DUF1566 domain-containing protein n=2 Tax=Maribacter aquimaris TaxID=2737171 RepID=A0ABR7V3Z7_9FLAO|nr:DUF1566 domain-containing protein [Maribacter aquimaris]